MTLKPHEVGEWIAVGARLTDPATGKPPSFDGCSVNVTVRRGSRTGTIVVNAEPGSVVDANRGDVQVGFRLDAAGTYYGTISVDKAGAPGWPVMEQFSVSVYDHA